jgi:hypothetical protein
MESGLCLVLVYFTLNQNTEVNLVLAQSPFMELRAEVTVMVGLPEILKRSHLCPVCSSLLQGIQPQWALKSPVGLSKMQVPAFHHGRMLVLCVSFGALKTYTLFWDKWFEDWSLKTTVLWFTRNCLRREWALNCELKAQNIRMRSRRREGIEVRRESRDERVFVT